MNFDDRLKETEKRLNAKLPKDYLEFIKENEGKSAGFDEWFFIDKLYLATEYDIPEFIIIEECPALLNEEDCKYLIPILKDNDAYVVIDIRKNGKGVFIIWSDETELGFQSANFTGFKEKIEDIYIKGNSMYDYFAE